MEELLKRKESHERIAVIYILFVFPNKRMGLRCFDALQIRLMDHLSMFFLVLSLLWLQVTFSDI